MRRASPAAVDPATGRKLPSEAATKVADVWLTRWRPVIDSARLDGIELPCVHTGGNGRCGEDCGTYAPHGSGLCGDRDCQPVCELLREIAGEVMADNYDLPMALSRKYRLGPHAELMESVALEAFYRSWLSFNPYQGSIGTHARRWVDGACQQALHRAKFDHLSDRAFEKRVPIRNEIERRRRAGEPLDVAAIAAATGANPTLVEQHLQPVSKVSMDAPMGSDEDARTVGEVVADRQAVVDDGLDGELLAAAGRELLAHADLPDVALVAAVALTGVSGADPVSPALLSRTLGVDVLDAATRRLLTERLATTEVAALGGTLVDLVSDVVADPDDLDLDKVAWTALLSS